ncbi:uncharacterized protein LOC123261344 [Cotesia glomerata]|uniref:uncharacterized protein LOC123261344 n=1 Tax=Cotesia glomerata TaxID=32391 RepID=UPI001D02D496|nr:uncharacterized protein LOC123261344 [Cotesia glomerata]
METDEIEIDLVNDNNNNEITPSQELLTSSQSTISQISNVSDFETELLSEKKIPKINIITPNLAAALDRANVSNRNATYILAATLQSVGIDLRNVNLSYKTIQRNRILLRKEIAEGLKKDLKFNDNYVVHWDGKLLSDIVGADVVDRLPILLTSSGAEQLLGIPKIGAGTGIEQASAVNSTLKHWGVSDYVKAVCFDTAYTNTGIHRGAGVELENLLGRKLIWLPCRHHVIELLIKGVFEVYWPTQNGPNVSIFGRFEIIGTR